MGFLVVAFLLERGARLVQIIGQIMKTCFDFNSGEFQPMEVGGFKKQLELMEILVDGCKSIQLIGQFYTTGNCEPCVKMWGKIVYTRKMNHNQ